MGKRAGLSKGETEAQGDPDVGGRPSWGEEEKSVCSLEGSDVCLPEGQSWSWQPMALRFTQTTLHPTPHYLYRLDSCLPVPISSGSRECGANRMLFLEREVGSLADTLTTCSWPCGISLFVPHDPRFQSVQSPCTL